MRAILLVLSSMLAALCWGQLPVGTPIKLMLLKEISSSSSMIGDVVPLVVTTNVEVDGQVVIPEGTIAFAKVSQCRREGALSAPLFDKPARLALRMEHLRDADGRIVPLWPSSKKSGDLQIVREMTLSLTGDEQRSIGMALANPESRPIMQKVRRLFTDSATKLTQKEALILADHNVNIPAVQQAIRSGLFVDVVNFISDLKRGRAIEALLKLSPVTRPAYIAVRAVRELSRLSGGIGNYIEGRFKGRNIRCSAGVELTVYSGTTATVPESSSTSTPKS